MIHPLGNSHIRMFGAYKAFGICGYEIGPTIAYNFFEHHLPEVLKYIDRKKVPKEDSIMFVVGEVDCRWHLPKQAQLQKRDIKDVTEECVKRYIRSLLHVKNMGYDVIAWGAHPSTTSGHNDDPQNPVFGDCVTRNKIGLYYNEILKELSEKNGMRFVSIFKHLIDDSLMTKMEYFIDYCHLNSQPCKDFCKIEFAKIGIDIDSENNTIEGV